MHDDEWITTGPHEFVDCWCGHVEPSNPGGRTLDRQLDFWMQVLDPAWSFSAVRARVVDVSPDSLIIEATGTEDKIDSLLEVLRPYGVIEMVRTGRVAMARGGVPVRQRADAARSDADAEGPESNVSNFSV